MNPSILLDHEPTPDPNRHVIRAMLRIDGNAPSAENRVPLNLSVVLDRSGSMSGPKLHYARDAAKQLLAHVYPDDTTSVVTFESGVEVVAAAAPRKTQTDLGSRISSIEPAGMTNLSGGWMEGRSQIDKFRADQQSNRIILMTDGHANEGITDHSRLAQILGEARAQGVTTSTIGFGQDFDERFLEQLADAGGGNTSYIEHPDQAPAVFKSELEELLALSAQNLIVEVRLNPGVELAAVHHSYPREKIEGGLRLRLGDLYASEPKTLLLELGALALADDVTPLATLELTGDVVTDEGGIEKRTISLPVSFSAAEGPVVHPEVRRTLVFLRAAAARREALEDERRGLGDEAASKLRSAASMVRELGDDPASTEEAEDLDLMATHLEEGRFLSAEAKYMSQRAYDTTRSKLGKFELLSRTRRADREQKGRTKN